METFIPESSREMLRKIADREGRETISANIVSFESITCEDWRYIAVYFQMMNDFKDSGTIGTNCFQWSPETVPILSLFIEYCIKDSSSSPKGLQIINHFFKEIEEGLFLKYIVFGNIDKLSNLR